MVEIKVIDMNGGRVVKHAKGDLLVADLFTDGPESTSITEMLIGTGVDKRTVIGELADLCVDTITSLYKNRDGQFMAVGYFKAKLAEAIDQKISK